MIRGRGAVADAIKLSIARLLSSDTPGPSNRTRGLHFSGVRRDPREGRERGSLLDSLVHCRFLTGHDISAKETNAQALFRIFPSSELVVAGNGLLAQGGVRWAVHSLIPFKDPDGKVPSVTGDIKDANSGHFERIHAH